MITLKKLILLLFFIQLSVFAQDDFNKANILLRNNEEVKGLAKISGNKIRFKKLENSKKETLNYKKVKKVVFDNGKTYVFKIMKRKIILVQKLVHGKISLYSLEKTQHFFDYTSNGAPRPAGSNNYTIHYFGKNDEDQIIGLLSEKDDKKIYKEFFSDCKKYTDLSLEERAALGGMVNAVKFYNENCK
ncbi:hypothetical protein ACOSP6_15490 [Tenacibaculum sp. MEBiC06402]|uniref:hypothetical protein n=1 Tax=unclassified Tenacibaculum TaxID=2635139 RepID=UPI003B9C9547